MKKEPNIPARELFVVYDELCGVYVGTYDSHKRASAEMVTYLFRVYDPHGERPTCYRNMPDVKEKELVSIRRYILDP